MNRKLGFSPNLDHDYRNKGYCTDTRICFIPFYFRNSEIIKCSKRKKREKHKSIIGLGLSHKQKTSKKTKQENFEKIKNFRKWI